MQEKEAFLVLSELFMLSKLSGFQQLRQHWQPRQQQITPPPDGGGAYVESLIVPQAHGLGQAALFFQVVITLLIPSIVPQVVADGLPALASTSAHAVVWSAAKMASLGWYENFY